MFLNDSGHLVLLNDLSNESNSIYYIAFIWWKSSHQLSFRKEISVIFTSLFFYYFTHPVKTKPVTFGNIFCIFSPLVSPLPLASVHLCATSDFQCCNILGHFHEHTSSLFLPYYQSFLAFKIELLLDHITTLLSKSFQWFLKVHEI